MKYFALLLLATSVLGVNISKIEQAPENPIAADPHPRGHLYEENGAWRASYMDH